MKVVPIVTLCVAMAAFSARGEPGPDIADIHKEADRLIRERIPEKAEAALELLQEALEEEPDNPDTLRRIGLVYALTPARRAEGIPYLEKAWSHGDLPSLEGLGIALVAMHDKAGMAKHGNDFIDNFGKLRGDGKLVGFFLASENRDEALFQKLLKMTRKEEIVENPALAEAIALLAKRSAENGTKPVEKP